MIGAALPIRDELTPAALRRYARHEPNRRASLRMLAIANALEGMSRAEAARLAGMERQALRDAVVRYTAEGLAGLRDRPKPGRPPRLSQAERAALAARLFRGPDPRRDGVAAWTRVELCGWLEARFGEPFHPSSLSRVLSASTCRGRRPGPSTPRPTWRPRSGSATGAARRLESGRRGPSGQADRAVVHGRGPSGAEGPAVPPLVAPRPPGRCDKRFEWAYLFAAAEPATGAGVALVLPEATTATVGLFPTELAASPPADVHAVLVLDGAGWHGARALAVPPNVTLVPLPAYSPELDPVERVWLYLRERFLSLRVFADHRAIVDACCEAWNRLVAEPGRLRSLCDQPWIRNVTS